MCLCDCSCIIVNVYVVKSHQSKNYFHDNPSLRHATRLRHVNLYQFFLMRGELSRKEKKIFILYFFYHLDVQKNVKRQTNHPIIINSEYLWLFSSRRFLTPNTHCSSNNCTVTIFFLLYHVYFQVELSLAYDRHFLCRPRM